MVDAERERRPSCSRGMVTKLLILELATRSSQGDTLLYPWLSLSALNLSCSILVRPHLVRGRAIPYSRTVHACRDHSLWYDWYRGIVLLPPSSLLPHLIAAAPAHRSCPHSLLLPPSSLLPPTSLLPPSTLLLTSALPTTALAYLDCLENKWEKRLARRFLFGKVPEKKTR